LLKDFVEKIVFRLIQENIYFLSKDEYFANRYKFSHEENRDTNLIKKRYFFVKS